MSVPKPVFDFEDWLRWRLSRYTPEGEDRRDGTLTLSESDLLTDLVFDYCRYSGEIEKRAKAICRQAIKDSESLSIDARGYYLKGEPRIRYDSMWRVVPDE